MLYISYELFIMLIPLIHYSQYLPPTAEDLSGTG